jgi:hypothetical protein
MSRLFFGKRVSKLPYQLAFTIMLGVGAFYSSVAAATDVPIVLTGADETPPVTTNASGSGTITINDDKTVSGSVKATGVVGTVAHIHVGAVGQAGTAIITLVKTGEDEWSVPPGAKLTDSQYGSFKAGNLYVNVHSEAHKGGEIRGQLKS